MKNINSNCFLKLALLMLILIMAVGAVSAADNHNADNIGDFDDNLDDDIDYDDWDDDYSDEDNIDYDDWDDDYSDEDDDLDDDIDCEDTVEHYDIIRPIQNMTDKELVDYHFANHTAEYYTFKYLTFFEQFLENKTYEIYNGTEDFDNNWNDENLTDDDIDNDDWDYDDSDEYNDSDLNETYVLSEFEIKYNILFEFINSSSVDNYSDYDFFKSVTQFYLRTILNYTDDDMNLTEEYYLELYQKFLDYDYEFIKVVANHLRYQKAYEFIDYLSFQYYQLSESESPVNSSFADHTLNNHLSYDFTSNLYNYINSEIEDTSTDVNVNETVTVNDDNGYNPFVFILLMLLLSIFIVL